VYFGYETVKAPTYDPFDPNTYNDANPDGYGKVLVGTRNVYNSTNNPDGSIGIAGYLYPNNFIPSENDANIRHLNGFFNLFDNNSDPNFYTKINNQNTFKLYDGGERHDYYNLVFDAQSKQYVLGNPPTRPYNFQTALYFGRRPPTFNGLISSNEGAAGVGINDQYYDGSSLQMCPPSAGTTRNLSYFTVNGIFNKQTTSTFTKVEARKVRLGVVTSHPSGGWQIEYFFNKSMRYGLVPPYLGKWYSPNRQQVGFNSNTDNYQIESGRTKIRIQDNNIIDSNSGITIDITDTTKSYLNEFFSWKSGEVINDIQGFTIGTLDTGESVLEVDYLVSYFFKIRYIPFEWSSYTTMPGFDDSSITSLRPDPWDIVPLDITTTDNNGFYVTNTAELIDRYNRTKTKTININEGFEYGMPDAYMLNDSIHGAGWCSIAWPSDYLRRIGPSKTSLTQQELNGLFEENRLFFTTEDSIGNSPYQIGLPMSTLFRIFTNGVPSGGPETFTASTSQGTVVPFGSTYNQQEFQRRNFYLSTYWSPAGKFISTVHDKTRRVKCFMKTGLYMNSQDQYYTKTTKDSLYSTNNFKYLVGYVKLPLYIVPDANMNETFRQSQIALSITPETNNGTLGTSISNTHTQTADDIQVQYGFVDLSANLSQLSSSYTKLNLSFLGYNTNNNTSGDVVITTHSGINVNNTNGVSFSNFTNEAGLRFADIEYSWDNQWVPFFTEMLRQIKERQTNPSYGGTNTNGKVVVVWLLGRQEAGNGSISGTALYGGLQGQDYMSQVYNRFITRAVSLGFAPQDILVLFVCHPKAAGYTKQVDATGRLIQDPRAYTSLYSENGYNDPKDIFLGVTKSIFYPFNENQNPSLGVLKNVRTRRNAEQYLSYVNSFRFLNPYTGQYTPSPTSTALASLPIQTYWRNCLYFDTPSVLGTVNINNRLNDTHYAVEYDVNGTPVTTYKYLNERGYLQFGKDFINILKNGL
jgi:hypothetical protein